MSRKLYNSLHVKSLSSSNFLFEPSSTDITPFNESVPASPKIVIKSKLKAAAANAKPKHYTPRTSQPSVDPKVPLLLIS